ncbi:MAG TPA: hypothetical protein VNC85_05070, partial [Mycobacteriales bacterium]|nr:hypothetical protein [Mycobacteriales bacterium]
TDVETGVGGSDHGQSTIEETTMEKITSADGTTLAPDWMRAAAAAVAATVPGATYRTVPGEDHAILRGPEVLAAEISRG